MSSKNIALIAAIIGLILIAGIFLVKSNQNPSVLPTPTTTQTSLPSVEPTATASATSSPSPTAIATKSAKPRH